MSRFDSYFLMKENDVPEYVVEKIGFFDKNAKLVCKEIGDGNLNYVFRVKDEESGKSIIVKQAGETLRISSDMSVSMDRGRIEARILQLQEKNAPGLVPKVYLYDEIMCAMIMQDMIGHTMMRSGLMKHETYPLFPEHISTFLVNSLISSTDIVMNHKDKKELVKEFINPDLCEISEDLVYTEPYNDCNHRNNVFSPNLDFVTKELYNDEKLHLEVAKCKFEFMNNAQALIHGDLHTGSIFINKEHTYVFDPEFAFYGPMGYDIGNIIANLLFAWCNGDATIEDDKKRKEYCDWVLDSIESIIDLFIEKYNVYFDENVSEVMALSKGFKEWYLSTVLRDTAAVTGLEGIRRIVGMANVVDITQIENQEKRKRAERICISVAKKCILNRNNYISGKAYREVIEEVTNRF